MCNLYSTEVCFLSDSYRRYNTHRLAEFYRKGEGALLIFQDSAPLEELDIRNKQFDEIVRHNQALVSELANIKTRMARWDAFFVKGFNKPYEQVAEELSKSAFPSMPPKCKRPSHEA